MRRAALLCLVLAAVSTVRANTIHVEGPPDTLALPPAEFSNHCTIRKAVITANTDSSAAFPQCMVGSGLDTIVFDGAFTITLAIPGDSEDAAFTGDLDITQSAIIDGNGSTLDGGALDRVFHIIGAGTTVTIRNLTIRNGHGVQGGGGILVDGATLNLENVTISGCVASAEDGGGIKVINGGTLNMTNCTISGNSTVVHGGAIAIDDGSAFATIINSTITANNGGFSNTTGGIHNTGHCTLRNTIVAGNSGVDIPNIDGTFVSNGYNIIGALGTVVGNPQIVATTGDQFGVNAADLHLGPLQDNGGPVLTRALGAGSIAIDQGHSSGSATDARGMTRPCDLTTLSNAAGGDGADVGAFEVQGTCAGTNTDPVAVNDSVTILEDSGANTLNVLSNDTDAEGDTLTITAVTQGAHGVSATNGTSVSYTPAHDFFGSDSFAYTVSDGNGGTATASVNVTVVNVNDPPVANADSYTINQDSVLTVATPAVLGNDVDVDNDPLTASVVSGVSHGTLSLASSGAFSYTPFSSFAGTDSFTYRANDGTVSSNVAAVTINVLDTQPPAIGASVATAMLWPPNHDLVNVEFAFSATDNAGGAVTTTVDVYSNEDDMTFASGDQSPDATRIGAGTLRLRAERTGSGSGRFYLIRVTAVDASSNASRKCVSVVVPASMSAAAINAINAQAQAASASCTASGLFVVGDGPVNGPKQ